MSNGILGDASAVGLGNHTLTNKSLVIKRRDWF